MPKDLALKFTWNKFGQIRGWQSRDKPDGQNLFLSPEMTFLEYREQGKKRTFQWLCTFPRIQMESVRVQADIYDCESTVFFVKKSFFYEDQLKYGVHKYIVLIRFFKKISPILWYNKRSYLDLTS